MPTLEEINAQILRTRERLHKLEGGQAGLLKLYHQLAQDLKDVRAMVGEIADDQEKASSVLAQLDLQVRQLLKTDEIAQAVAAELRKKLAWGWKVVGGLLVIVSIAGGIKGLIGA